MTRTTGQPTNTAVTVSVNPEAGDMRVVDLGVVDLSDGIVRLAGLEFGPVSVLVSSDKLDELDRLTEMVVEARALLTLVVS